MNQQPSEIRLKLVYFSPTGTTKAVINEVANGFGNARINRIDITTPDNRLTPITCSGNEVLVIAVPVYMGRVPDLIHDYLCSIQTNGNYAVPIAVYGNRAYENALLELNDILIQIGCKVIAGAAFIGEHSFASKDIPGSLGRPNYADLSQARNFGSQIHDKIRDFHKNQLFSDIGIPGSYPYGGVTQLWDVDFIEVNEKCTSCGFCSSICPTGAITKSSPGSIDIHKCITCCACIKACPQSARSMKEGLVKEAAYRVNRLYNTPKAPEIFV